MYLNFEIINVNFFKNFGFILIVLGRIHRHITYYKGKNKFQKT